MQSILLEAEELTKGARNDDYGHPLDDFGKVAQLTQPIKESNIPDELKHALYMIQVKVARLLNTPDHRDSVVDIAGYANTYDMVIQERNHREGKPDLSEVPF